MLLPDPWLLFAFNLCAGLALGQLLFRADYCMAGMFRDIFLFRNYTLLRSLSALISVTMVLFFLINTLNPAQLYPPPNLSYASYATVLGGVIFGVGMVLAGGCTVGTLYKMGSGSLASAVAFLGIMIGSILYAGYHPFWESIRANTIIVKIKFLGDLSPAFGTIAVAFFAAASMFAVLRWIKQGKWNVTAHAEGYLQPWKAAVGIALVSAAIYFFSGWPMGITTAYAKVGAYVKIYFFPVRVSELAYFNQNHITAVVSGTVVSGGAGPRMDIISYTELALMIGIVAGAFFTALLLGEFRIRGLPPKRQLASAFVGGALMGFGARIASGCNLKFVLGALPLLSIQGMVFVAAMIVGAYLGAKLIKRFVIV